MRSRHNLLRGLFSAVIIFCCVALGQPALAAVNDYPQQQAPCVHPPYTIFGYCPNYDWGLVAGNTSPSNIYSLWGYGFRNCTDWVAWRLNQSGVEAWKWRYLGDARSWPAAARTRGFALSSTPSVGAVAIIPSNHVAYVEEVRSDGTILLSEYNALGTGLFRTWSGLPSQRGISGYLQFQPGISGSFSEGSFWQAEDNSIWHIVGGAALYVSNWSHIGGPRPFTRTSRAALATLSRYPRDGTLVGAGPSGRVYTIVGGTAFYVSSWANIGGARAATKVDDWVIDNQLRQLPPDGTLMSGGQSGRVFQIVGGAPLYISSWSVVGGPRSVFTIDEWSISQRYHLRPYPVDGSIVRGSNSGRIYILAGGTPLYLTNWSLLGGPKPYQTIDDWVLNTNYNQGYRAFPARGSFLQGLPSKRIWQSDGDQLRYITNWSQVGGPQTFTSVDDWAIRNQLSKR